VCSFSTAVSMSSVSLMCFARMLSKLSVSSLFSFLNSFASSSLSLLPNRLYVPSVVTYLFPV
jgi:hypothetical protein